MEENFRNIYKAIQEADALLLSLIHIQMCIRDRYTVVSSWAYDGENEETGMEKWKKAGIGIDIVIVLFMAGMEVLVIRGYKKRKNAE